MRMEVGTRVRILAQPVGTYPPVGTLGTIAPQKGFSALEVVPDVACPEQTPDDMSLPYFAPELEVI